MAVCGYIWAVAIILKKNNLQQDIDKNNYELVHFWNCELNPNFELWTMNWSSSFDNLWTELWIIVFNVYLICIPSVFQDQGSVIQKIL